MIDHLSYPDPSQTDDPTDRIANWPNIPNPPARPDSDKLRAWCMSTKDSINPSHFYLTGTYTAAAGSNTAVHRIDHKKNDWVDPDNLENQMGIVYSQWLNSNSNYTQLGSSFEENNVCFIPRVLKF